MKYFTPNKILLASFALILSLAALFNRGELLEFLQELQMRVEDMPLVAAAILIALKTLAAPLGVPGGPLTIFSGVLFSPGFGFAVSLVGNTLGATLAFLLARYVLRDYVQRSLLKRHPRMREFEERLEKRALSTVIALRLIPLVPFNALNFILGVTNIRVQTYVFGSLIGMIPGTFAYVYFGSSLTTLNPAVIALALLGIVILVYVGGLFEKHTRREGKGVRVVQYKWEGSWGPFRIKTPCGECAANEGITKDALAREFAGEDISFETRPWLNNWWRVLLKGGYHAPMTFVNGKLVAQGAVIDRGLLAYRVRSALVKGYDVPKGANIIFTKPDCSFCTRAKELLAHNGIAYEERDIIENPLFARQLFALAKRVLPPTTPVTTPQVWLGGRYVGGLTQLSECLTQGSGILKGKRPTSGEEAPVVSAECLKMS